MAQYLSEDLRVRVIRAVEGGMSRNAAARRFGVSIASAVRWMAEYQRTGRTLDAWIAAELAAAEKAVTAGVRAAAAGLKDRWRGQITGAGLGPRLARTIRQRDFPVREPSLKAASLVYSRAATILHAFDQGVTIRSKHGFFLAIPTAAAGVRGPGGKRITPGGWERRTGMRLRFVYRRRGPSLLVADDARLSRAGLARTKRGRRRRDGILTGAQTLPIFLLVPQVSLRKRLDLDRDTRWAEAELPALIATRWTDTS